MGHFETFWDILRQNEKFWKNHISAHCNFTTEKIKNAHTHI